MLKVRAWRYIEFLKMRKKYDLRGNKETSRYSVVQASNIVVKESLRVPIAGRALMMTDHSS